MILLMKGKYILPENSVGGCEECQQQHCMLSLQACKSTQTQYSIIINYFNKWNSVPIHSEQCLSTGMAFHPQVIPRGNDADGVAACKSHVSTGEIIGP
jgi:hypothetical protein